MPRKSREEAMEIGRIAGLIARKDRDLWELIKEKAEEKGVSPGDIVTEALRVYIEYDPYRQIDGRTIMLTLDILDRIYNYMNGWRKQTALVDMLEYMKLGKELAETLGPMYGLVSREELEKIEKEVRRRVEQELMEKVSKTGKVSAVIDKIVDKLVDQIVESVINKMEEHGIIEDIAKIAEEATKESVKTENEDIEVELVEPEKNKS